MVHKVFLRDNFESSRIQIAQEKGNYLCLAQNPTKKQQHNSGKSSHAGGFGKCGSGTSRVAVNPNGVSGQVRRGVAVAVVGTARAYFRGSILSELCVCHSIGTSLTDTEAAWVVGTAGTRSINSRRI